jgi:predicted Zn finger-like uncharacterized protein
MSLATRCTACGTVFRVVQDQLKISEGWVRCGRCNEVFNALEGLFDLERDAPTDWPSSGSGGEPPEHAEWTDPHPAVAPAPPSMATDFLQVEKIDAQLHGRSRDSTPAMRINERDRLDFPDARFEPESGDEDDGDAAAAAAEAAFSVDAAAPATADKVVSPAPPAPTATAAAAPAPQFLRRNTAPQRWQKPPSRIGATFCAVLLIALLAGQVGHHFRDLAVAQWPALRPAYAQWCDALRCSIRPPARIDDISVQSSALTRAATPDAFRLAVTLRNHGKLALALPAIDLSLTDATGGLVARRVLTLPAAGGATIAPGAESALQWTLTAGSARVTGYTVEVFYP